MSKRVIVTGLIAQYPLGGMAWHYLQYLLACRDLGWRCVYVEDTGQYPYDPETGGLVDTADRAVSYLATVMKDWGFEDQWAYRAPWNGEWFGHTGAACQEACREADVILNVSGVLRDAPALVRSGALVFIDTDPVFTQIKLLKGQEPFGRYVAGHDAHFTFGEQLSAPFSGTEVAWRPTRQPVSLDAWVTTEPPERNCFTTVMNWTSYRDMEWDGTRYGQKDGEFMKIMGLPAGFRRGLFEIAVNAGKTKRTPADLLQHRGWRTANPDVVAGSPAQYRDYIQRSLGEVTVAKGGYVAARSGWFSERSACYLAAGRPVVCQDTGFSRVLPTGEGLMAFETEGEAALAVRSVLDDYERHSTGARRIAEEYFAGPKVLTALLSQI